MSCKLEANFYSGRRPVFVSHRMPVYHHATRVEYQKLHRTLQGSKVVSLTYCFWQAFANALNHGSSVEMDVNVWSKCCWKISHHESVSGETRTVECWNNKCKCCAYTRNETIPQESHQQSMRAKKHSYSTAQSYLRMFNHSQTDNIPAEIHASRRHQPVCTCLWSEPRTRWCWQWAWPEYQNLKRLVHTNVQVGEVQRRQIMQINCYFSSMTAV